MNIMLRKSRINYAINKLLEDDTAKTAYDRQAAIIEITQMIRKWRVDANLSQKRLAYILGTKQSVISRLESSDNESFPNLDTVISIAHACNKRFLIGFDELTNHEKLNPEENKHLVAL